MKIKHWDEQSQLWIIDGASNAANIELSNPGYLDENGESISVDLGFTKLDNRLNKIERNIAWIYQNGAKGGGGGGGGGGGTSESTEYTITVEEGNRVYTAGTSVTIHLTINGGSLRKIFQVEITNAATGERLASPVITGLTRTEVTINGLNESTLTLKISAHTGLYYASDYILTVVAGAIKLLRTRVPASNIYPTSLVTPPVFLVSNSTDSDLKVVVLYITNEQRDAITLIEYDIPKTGSGTLDFIMTEVSNFLHEQAQVNIGETYTFYVYAQGVLNDQILKSNVVTFSTTITSADSLFIITYGVNRKAPENESDLAVLNLFVYGQSVQFEYELSYASSLYPIYDMEYVVSPCYFEDGVLVTREDLSISGEVNRISKGVSSIFSFSTASLPNDTIYDTTFNEYKFIKVWLRATSTDNPEITDTKVIYFTLKHPVEKYITATNFDRSLVCYYSPVMGVPTGNVSVWRYDNQNTQFPYNTLGIVQLRYIDLVGYNLNGIRNGFNSQGMHLTGKSYALLGLNLFSSRADEINLLNSNGFTISTTFRTDANIDESSVVLSLGKYLEGSMAAGIEILASKVRVLVNKQETSLNITKGDLVTIDVVLERYVGEGDSEDAPMHWFIKIFLNGVLSSLGSYTNDLFTSVTLGTGWYFDTFPCLGAHVEGEEVISSADVHFYDFKVYSTALSDNEIVQNYASAIIYSELDNGANPSLTLLTEILSKNFILINTEGEYESILFDEVDPKLYKDDDTLLSTLRAALADSKIPYPIVVLNQITPDPNFFGTTQAQFSEDLKIIVTGQAYRYSINMDYYTMGNAAPTRISNSDRMKASIQGTSSLQFVSKNYEIYMGTDEEGKDVLVQMKEDWLPENEFTLKADVMDSAHVNNVLIGSIINGMVKSTDSSGNEVSIKPLENTPPMNTINQWASKIKHTSEGYPVILFINFMTSTGSSICKCQGIYNFNLGRAASFNLGLKLLNNCTFVDNAVSFPRMVETYEENTVIANNSPVYSVEVGENNAQIGAFDQDSPDVLTSGIFDTIYQSDGAVNTHLLRLFTFLAGFGYNIENPKKRLVDGQWVTPRFRKVDNAWEEQGYYLPANPADYVQSTLELHMNWNNLIAYYMIAIIFGLVDSMGKNLTLRTWNMVNDENGVPQCVWYMCFYDMDTAMRLDNDGNEVVPYNAHLNRYYTDNSGVFSEVRVQTHCASIPGLFTQVYSSYNTRLQEIAENLKDVVKKLEDVYVSLRNNLFPDPGKFIDQYYTGQINLIGAALYNYDYKLKYLLTKKQYSVQTGELVGTHDYNQISYLHGNGSTNIKSWFKKRIRFLDGVYGASTDGTSTLNNSLLVDVTLNELWSLNQAIKNVDDPTVIQLTLTSESLTFVNISAGSGNKNVLWINEVPTVYKVKNVSGLQRVSIYGNKVLTLLDGFNKFRWVDLSSIDFPLIKSLSLEGQTNINADAFLTSLTVTGLQSLRELNLRGVHLIRDSQVVYKSLDFTRNLPSLEKLDISNSSFNDIILPESGVLKEINASNTKIIKIEFNGLPLLESLNLSNCVDLQYIKLLNCPKIRSLVVPTSVHSIILSDCPGLEELTCTFSGRLISSLEEVNISSCEGLKTINLSGLNNPELMVNLMGAPNIENLNLSGIVTDNITFSDRWTSLKSINISRTDINTLNYAGSISTILDLSRHRDLEYIQCNDNASVTEVKFPNRDGHYTKLGNNAFSDCPYLSRLIGNFLITGTKVFTNCSSLRLNNDYTGVILESPFIEGNFCNISFDDELSSYAEMFEGCASLSGQDFRYIMVRVKPNVVSLNSMFRGCTSTNVAIWRDIFNKCPNVTDITSFCEGSGITGAFYSNTSDNTGILGYLPNLINASYAFARTNIQWIDNNAFLGCSSIRDANFMFQGCSLLKSCDDVYNPEPGYLHSKDFFLNLTGLLSVVPQGMFRECVSVKMLIDSEEMPNGEMFDYLFHYPTEKLIDTFQLNDSLYTGVKLSGTIHANVFGGIQNEFNGYSIPLYTVINSPFANSGGELKADLYYLERIFENMNPTLLTNVFKGVSFNDGATNVIPNNILRGCSNLINITGLFSNNTINNNGNEYIFPAPELFLDCTSLLNVSNLFEGDSNLNIRLVGNGFINSPITNVSGMLRGSGVFGVIPYKFLRTSGKTIVDLSGIFERCYKLGYTKDRSFIVGLPYYITLDRRTVTSWDDAVVDIPGTRLHYSLDYYYYSDIDEYYIDGNPWPASMQSLDIFDSEVQQYDELQQQVLTDTLGRTEGVYQNYMFPADLFYSCSDDCNFKNALVGLSYRTHYLVTDESGFTYMEEGEMDGLKGRIPMKLFKNNPGITKILNLFDGLDFSPFIGFNSYIYDTLLGSARDARGLLLPPDLFRYTPNINTLEGTFLNTSVRAGIDMNLNLSYLPQLESVKNMMMDVLFADAPAPGRLRGDDPDTMTNGSVVTYPQVEADTFIYNHNLSNISYLFGVTDILGETKGLIHVSSTMFLPEDRLIHPYLSDISGTFYNNRLLTGSIPLMEGGSYIISYMGYIEGVSMSNISNSAAYMSAHPDMSWWPTAWRTNQ